VIGVILRTPFGAAFRPDSKESSPLVSDLSGAGPPLVTNITASRPPRLANVSGAKPPAVANLRSANLRDADLSRATSAAVPTNRRRPLHIGAYCYVPTISRRCQLQRDRPPQCNLYGQLQRPTSAVPTSDACQSHDETLLSQPSPHFCSKPQQCQPRRYRRPHCVAAPVDQPQDDTELHGANPAECPAAKVPPSSLPYHQFG
jgi:hypothetical protein